MPEAQLERTENGLVPEGEGWFVLNARDAPWGHSDGLGSACFFESQVQKFPQLGFNVNVLPPGDKGGMYHAEGNQEGFLVLAGEGVAIVEGEERQLRPWDYFHCPADTPHVLVATGTEPFVYIAAGRRGPKDEPSRLVYPVDETARKYGAGVAEETTEGRLAYEGFEVTEGPFREGDLPGYVSRSAR
jgi:mannose-6-phosphate isomerase-like protein (cupin superfamily)